MAVNTGLFTQGFRQVETIQLAPDALVIINGSSSMTDASGNNFDVREDITEITVTLNTESSPGTANFTISIPDQAQNKLVVYQGLKVMSEIEIYFRGRFLKSIPASGSDIPTYPYYKSFWGIVSAVTENYSEGVHTITVSCADILRWWQITNINVNPSLLGSGGIKSLKSFLQRTYGMTEAEYQANINTFMQGRSIKINEGEREISIFGNRFSDMTIPEIFQNIANVSLLTMAPLGDYLDYDYEVEHVTTAITKLQYFDMMNYWSQRMGLIGAHLRIYGLTSTKFTKQQAPRYTINLEALQSVHPIPLFTQTISLTKTERKSQLEIANILKEAIQFEFFMDVNGDIIFKPPFFNMDVRNNVNSIIDDIDIINWTILQSESEVVTRVDVNGAISQLSPNDLITNGIAQDPNLALQFGERIVVRSMNWLTSKKQCLLWAKLELGRYSANIRQGSMTIMGRPELRLGYPVYVPSRDCFYYIKGIDHHFSFGGSFTTTLTLIGERRKGAPNSVLRNVGQITGQQNIVSGGSNAAPTANNNFVKQLFNPTVCTPRAQEHATIIQPSFAIDLSKIDSDQLGEWDRFSDVKVADTSQPDVIQTTDSEGYELIGATSGIENELIFKYGSTISFDPTGKIQGITQQTPTQSAASQALFMDVSKSSLVIDPNNVGLTLDQVISNTQLDTASKASIAANITTK